MTHVDYADHLALVAEVFEDGQETVVAEARYVRRADPSVAEFAVSVADQWQGKGLASRLLAKLALPRVHGRRAAHGRRNAGHQRQMLHLARKAGFTIRRSPDVRGVVLLEKTVEPAAQGTPCNDAAAVFAAA